MKVVIVEDEPQAAQRLENLLRLVDSKIEVLIILDSVKKSTAWLKSNPEPDLIFMDIQLADGLSFEIFEQTEVVCSVIFTTAFDEYALKAFKVNSIDYLLKPFDKEELQRSIAKYNRLTSTKTDSSGMMESISYAMQMLTKKYKQRFVLKVGEHLKSVEVSEILFFFSLEKTTFCQTKEGRKHILDFTLDQLEGLLDPQRFFRINRKYIVAVDSLQDMVSYANSRLRLILKTSDDNDVIVSRERVQEFKEWLDR